MKIHVKHNITETHSKRKLLTNENTEKSRTKVVQKLQNRELNRS